MTKSEKNAEKSKKMQLDSIPGALSDNAV